jgi:DNA repair exonuclease SbcCD ATPase subunit
MIIQRVRGKNFLSIGNAFNEVEFTGYKKTVMFGENGAGKSTTGNMITFALFDKTIKEINKPQVVNSINTKNCLVEIDFISNGKQYTVRRGIKPSVFDIIEDGVALDATLTGDFQDYLEKNILKINYRTFMQTTILSIENYTPFMSLSKGDRRNFIEDILDIRVFTYMNQIVKTRVAKNKEELKLLNEKLRGLKQNIELQKTHITQLENIRTFNIDEIESRQKSAQALIDQNEIKLAGQKKQIECLQEKITDIEARLEEYKKLTSYINKIDTKIASKLSELSFFDENDGCPTCKQKIDPSHIKTVYSDVEKEVSTYQSAANKYRAELESYEGIEELYSTTKTDISTVKGDMNVTLFSINASMKEVARCEAEKNSQTITGDITKLKETLRDSAKESLDIMQDIASITTDQEHNTAMQELLKDDGIKGKIVEQFIPVINSYVNDYLSQLDFFVSFELDSEFKEVIKSRHRDKFSYSSFSAGERQRIDLAMLLTFRNIAKMRSAFECNLLFFDEILDSSLDEAGIENLMKIIDATEDNINVFVVSHRSAEKFAESFDRLIHVKKENNFSHIETVTKL